MVNDVVSRMRSGKDSQRSWCWELDQENDVTLLGTKHGGHFKGKGVAWAN